MSGTQECITKDDCKSPPKVLLNLNLNIPRGTPKSTSMHLCQLAIKSNDARKVVSHVQSFGVNMRGKNGFQALHFAACYGRSEIAAYLLHPLGADVNSQTARGNTPLHIACFETMIPMIELLVHHGADPGVINWQKKNPVDMAQRPRTLQVLTRTLQARSGGFLTNPSKKLFLHYYQFFGLNVGATQNEICSAFKEVLRSIFLKRGVSDETRHVDLQEACEAFLVLRSSHNRSIFEHCPSPKWMKIEFLDQHYLDTFIKKQMNDAMKTLSPRSNSSFTAPTCSPGSPLPDVSVVSLSSGASFAASPLHSLADTNEGEKNGAEEMVMNCSLIRGLHPPSMNSPTVKFSSPPTSVTDRTDASKPPASPICGKIPRVNGGESEKDRLKQTTGRQTDGLKDAMQVQLLMFLHLFQVI